MLKSYIKIAFRNLWKQKGYSFLNIAGLAIGLACAFLIAFWIWDEMSYDRFHESGDRIYRVLRHTRFGDDVFTQESAPLPLLQAIKEFPEVEDVAYTSRTLDFVLKKDELAARQQGLFANQDFFNIFSWNLIEGDGSSVLSNPSSIAISASLADKYFGSAWRNGESIIGQSIRGELIRMGHREDFIVSGVFEDVPHNSSLEFDFVLPIEVFISLRDIKSLTNWHNSNFYFYVRIQEGFDGAALSEKIVDLQNNHIQGFRSDLFLQPYTDQHLHSNFEDGKLTVSRIEYYVRMFAVIAFMIILIACINFMNLSTARSMRRAREVGVRKAIGAGRRSLIGQFMGESLLLVFIAFILAAGLTIELLPAFNNLTGKEVTIADLDGSILLVFAGIALLTALIAGTYPAFYLSSFDAVRILRGTFNLGSGGTQLRKGLVVFQFAMSILLVFGTITVYQQIQYIHSKNLGLNRENVISLRLEGKMRSQQEVVRQELQGLPGIALVTTTSQSPLDITSSTHNVSWRGKDPNSEIEFHVLNVNYDFLEIMKMELVSGRNFNPAFALGPLNCIVNETAADILGLENPVGESLNFSNNETGNIIGIVRDFHMSSFYSKIEPTIIRLRPQQTWELFLRTEPGRTEEALASLKSVYEQFNPEHPFEYRFLDDRFDQMYRSEMVIGKLAGYFTVIALFIACLGLFGLASFSAQQRTKEIGVRKVLGATVTNIVSLLSKDFIKLVLVGFVFAVPIAWYTMNQWLADFAYRIEIGPGIFAIAGSAALLIALATVSWQSVKAALMNPVNSLRSE